MRAALTVEWRKLARSPVVWTATALMVVMLPAMALGFYTVAINGGTGALAAKAEAFLVEEGWVGYLSLVGQIAAVAMFLGSGVVVSWAFGREHADRTFASLFALPVSRREIALAKFAVLSAWITVLSALVTLLAVVMGLVGGVGTPGSGLPTGDLVRVFTVSLSTCLVVLPVGYVASVGRGYLPAIGALIVVVAAAQIAVLFGTGQWFPFAVPGLMAVAGAEGVPTLSVLNISLVPITIFVGVWITVLWWRTAEAV